VLGVELKKRISNRSPNQRFGVVHERVQPGDDRWVWAADAAQSFGGIRPHQTVVIGKRLSERPHRGRGGGTELAERTRRSPAHARVWGR
jgi:hypothetical protein